MKSEMTPLRKHERKCGHANSPPPSWLYIAPAPLESWKPFTLARERFCLGASALAHMVAQAQLRECVHTKKWSGASGIWGHGSLDFSLRRQTYFLFLGGANNLAASVEPRMLQRAGWEVSENEAEIQQFLTAIQLGKGASYDSWRGVLGMLMRLFEMYLKILKDGRP